MHKVIDYVVDNRQKAGISVGIGVPLILFCIAIVAMSSNFAFWGEIRLMFMLRALSKVLSLCVYPNLAVFYLYLHFDKNRSAKGVIIGTFIMALVVLLVFVAQKMY